MKERTAKVNISNKNIMEAAHSSEALLHSYLSSVKDT